MRRVAVLTTRCGKKKNGPVLKTNIQSSLLLCQIMGGRAGLVKMISYSGGVSAGAPLSSAYTVAVTGMDTPTHSRVFLYFDYFLHCRIIAKTSQL